ncbi:Uncharacterised protein [Buttiauxella agrestis]|uniref:Uncharacterized protein n=1 Tax=Buttiauxella agrestis TaxID=82977 RepID=A0A381KRC9_9ENTR|nr:Uncharacterised protein [Buttiauxella agrestis]
MTADPTQPTRAETVTTLRQQGLKQREAAELLGVSVSVVKKFWNQSHHENVIRGRPRVSDARLLEITLSEGKGPGAIAATLGISLATTHRRINELKQNPFHYWTLTRFPVMQKEEPVNVTLTVTILTGWREERRIRRSTSHSALCEVVTCGDAAAELAPGDLIELRTRESDWPALPELPAVGAELALMIRSTPAQRGLKAKTFRAITGKLPVYWYTLIPRAGMSARPQPAVFRYMAAVRPHNREALTDVAARLSLLARDEYSGKTEHLNAVSLCVDLLQSRANKTGRN